MKNNTYSYINIQIIINNVVDLIELFWKTAKYANLCELLYFLQYCNHGYKMRPTIQMLSTIERSAPSKSSGGIFHWDGRCDECECWKMAFTGQVARAPLLQLLANRVPRTHLLICISIDA